MNCSNDFEIPGRQKLIRILALLGLAGIAVGLSSGNFLLLVIIILLPVTIIALLYILQYPSFFFFLIFTCNYFIMGVSRYVNIDGIGVVMDSMLAASLILLFIHAALMQNIEWKYALNVLTLVSLLWIIYCTLEIMNPTADMKAWVLSRGVIFYGFIISVITSLLITRFRQVNNLLLLYAVFTSLAIAKVLIQKYIGFDHFENLWLDKEGGLTHLIHSGTRYFSFFTDAGNFGSNMGCAGIIFGIVTFFTPSKRLKIYYGLVCVLALYAMFLSGTRGAMIVPLGGLALFVLIGKNYKAIIGGGVLLLIIYSFFAFTHIGDSNALIRRMRSTFNPNKDASFIVRKENQKKLATYLKYRPFGEGLGLSGGENKKISVRFTTTIPNDSWYVKIWVETGIVGLILYISGLIAIVIKCALIIMFKIKDKELKGILSGFLCGVFGLMLSSYGNPIWGQYPTMLLAYIFLSLILKGEYFDKQIETKKRLL